MDLQGGDYLISQPLVFPSNFSNFALSHGTLRASAAFPPNAFLVEVGTPNAYCSNWGDSCNEDASLEDLLLDGSGVAGGGVRFNAVIGVNAGPDIYVVNFTDKGIVMEGGHEVLLHEAWVGACWYTPPGLCWLNGTALGNTTGVWINGNDHALTDVIVFAGQSGIVVDGAANIITAAHTWNTCVYYPPHTHTPGLASSCASPHHPPLLTSPLARARVHAAASLAPCPLPLAFRSMSGRTASLTPTWILCHWCCRALP
jgi:hypothetical protein